VTVQRRACGLVNGYRDPAQLGVDRWLGALAAWCRIAGPVCTIDCGTAMTVNVVSEHGEFLGGTISAGLGLMHEALAGRTAALTLPLAGPTAWPATDTDTAIRTGCLEAAAGLAERALGRLQRLSAGEAVALVTGGDAPLLMPLLGDGFTHVPGLVLEGLLALSGEPQ
jgi:type III pantothenate kinase